MSAPATNPLSADVMAFCDDQLDHDVCLLVGPPAVTSDQRTMNRRHLVRESAWYALGLLRRDRPELAERVLDAVLDVQWDAPGTAWHGTFRRHPEEPDPRADARMWRDYDPNWRQFIGVTLLLVLRELVLPERLQHRMRVAVERALDGEPADRLDARYTNIALMQAWLLTEAGAHLDRPDWQVRGAALAHDIEARFAQWGVFDEYNSPTYYGVDLVGLALWARHSAQLARAGKWLEAALWEDLLAWYHPLLGTQCGPFSRAYGMHMAQHVTLQGLWMACCSDAPQSVPLPRDNRWPEHGHDLCMLLLIEALLPPQRMQLRSGVRRLERDLPDGRVAAGWLGERVMLGAERGGAATTADQYHPLTAHWLGGWLRLRGFVCVDAELADDGAIEVRVRPSRRGPAPFWLEISGPMQVPAAGQHVVHCGAASVHLGGRDPAHIASGRIGWDAPCEFLLRVVPT